MPVKHGRTARTIRANLSRNIATERRAGMPRRRAVAIAYSVARQDARKAHIRVPKGLGPKRRPSRR
jgi:hypothetical protein